MDANEGRVLPQSGAPPICIGHDRGSHVAGCHRQDDGPTFNVVHAALVGANYLGRRPAMLVDADHEGLLHLQSELSRRQANVLGWTTASIGVELTKSTLSCR